MNEQVIKEAIRAIQDTADIAIRAIQDLTYDNYKVGAVEMSRNSEDDETSEIHEQSGDPSITVDTSILDKYMKVKSKETMYNWDSGLIPRGVEYIARDKDGCLYGFRTKPSIVSKEGFDEWDVDGRDYVYLTDIGTLSDDLITTILNKYVAWTESLEKRPE